MIETCSLNYRMIIVITIIGVLLQLASVILQLIALLKHK